MSQNVSSAAVVIGALRNNDSFSNQAFFFHLHYLLTDENQLLFAFLTLFRQMEFSIK